MPAPQRLTAQTPSFRLISILENTLTMPSRCTSRESGLTIASLIAPDQPLRVPPHARFPTATTIRKDVCPPLSWSANPQKRTRLSLDAPSLAPGRSSAPRGHVPRRSARSLRPAAPALQVELLLLGGRTPAHTHRPPQGTSVNAAAALLWPTHHPMKDDDRFAGLGVNPGQDRPSARCAIAACFARR